jgi:hypothetical protein
MTLSIVLGLLALLLLLGVSGFLVYLTILASGFKH